MRSCILLLLLIPALAPASQVSLTPADVIGFKGFYSSLFLPQNILDHQTGTITECCQDGSFWLNSDNGPADAYIVIDLEAAFQVTSVELFNTHNGPHNDRGTGDFSIEAGNSVAAAVGGGSGFDLTGPTVTLVNGTLSAVSLAQDPITGQTFAVSDGSTYRYLKFEPHSVATSASSCCGDNNYGLNELRVFSDPVASPEPAPLALIALPLTAIAALRRKVLRKS